MLASAHRLANRLGAGRTALLVREEDYEIAALYLVQLTRQVEAAGLPSTRTDRAFKDSATAEAWLAEVQPSPRSAPATL